MCEHVSISNYFIQFSSKRIPELHFSKKLVIKYMYSTVLSLIMKKIQFTRVFMNSIHSNSEKNSRWETIYFVFGIGHAQFPNFD